MSKYYKFHYDAGYVGTDVDEVFKFSDDTSERKVEEIFDDWYDDQRSDSGVYGINYVREYTGSNTEYRISSTETKDI